VALPHIMRDIVGAYSSGDVAKAIVLGADTAAVSQMNDLVHEQLVEEETEAIKNRMIKEHGGHVKLMSEGERLQMEDQIQEEIEAQKIRNALIMTTGNMYEKMSAAEEGGEPKEEHKAFVPIKMADSKVHNVQKKMQSADDKLDVWGHVGEVNYLTGEEL